MKTFNLAKETSYSVGPPREKMTMKQTAIRRAITKQKSQNPLWLRLFSYSSSCSGVNKLGSISGIGSFSSDFLFDMEDEAFLPDYEISAGVRCYMGFDVGNKGMVGKEKGEVIIVPIRGFAGNGA